MTREIHVGVRFREWSRENVEGVAAAVGAAVGWHQAPQLRYAEFVVDEARADEVIAALRADPRVQAAATAAPVKPQLFQQDVASAGMTTFQRGTMWPRRQEHLTLFNVINAWRDTRGAAPFAWGIIDEFGDTLSTNHGWLCQSLAVNPGNATSQLYGTAPAATALRYPITFATATAADVGSGVMALTDQGVKVINLSLGILQSEDPLGVLWDALTYADQEGAVCVWAAGNANVDTGSYFAINHPTSFVVGGIQNTGEVSGMNWQDAWMADSGGPYGFPWTSSHGDWVDITAPLACLVQEPTLGPSPFGGTSLSCPIVAGIIHLVCSVNHGLTGMQAAQIVKSTAARSRPREQWMFDSYFTDPACGVPDAEAAVTKAKTTLPENAGVVFPYLRIHPRTPNVVHGDAYGHISHPFADVQEEWSGTSIVTHTGGQIGFQIEGWCSTGPVTEVELWINGVREYIGPPRTTWAGLYEKEEWRDRLWDLHIVARTATGQVASRSYITGAPEVGAVNIAAFDVGHVRREIPADAAVSETRAVSLAADAHVGNRYWLTRSASAGRSFVAGPMEPVDSFRQPTRKLIAADAVGGQVVLRPLLSSAVVAERMRPVVAASAAVRYSTPKVVPADAAVAGQVTKVAFVSAVVSSTGLRPVPASAAVLNPGVIAVASADAAVAETWLNPTSADAVVMEVGRRTCFASAFIVLAAPRAEQIAADAAVADLGVRRSVTADAYVPLEGTEVRQVPASAAVRGTLAPVIVASAFVQVEGYGRGSAVVTADAAVQSTPVRSVAASAFVGSTGTVYKAVAASAAVRGREVALAPADAAVRFTSGVTIYADAVVTGSPTRSVAADAAVFTEGNTKVVPVSAAVRLRFTPGIFADAAVIYYGTAARVTADAVVSWVAERPVPASAMVVERSAQVVDADALVAEPVRLLVPVDADAFVADAARVTADAFVFDPRGGRRGAGRAHIRSGRGGVRIRRGRERGEI